MKTMRSLYVLLLNCAFRMELRRLSVASIFAIFLMSTVPSHAAELALDLTPDRAQAAAELAVKVVQQLNGQRLDYSPGSLATIDRLVLGYKAEGHSPQSMNKTLIVLGCYVGEVFVRNLGVKWANPTEAELAIGFDATGIRMANGGLLNPIGKVFKLIQNGPEDSVVHFYEVFSRDIPGVPRISDVKP